MAKKPKFKTKFDLRGEYVEAAPHPKEPEISSRTYVYRIQEDGRLATTDINGVEHYSPSRN